MTSLGRLVVATLVFTASACTGLGTSPTHSMEAEARLERSGADGGDNWSLQVGGEAETTEASTAIPSDTTNRGGLGLGSGH